MCVCFLLEFDTDDWCFLVSVRHVYYTKFGAPSHVCVCVSVDGPGCSTCMYMAFSKFDSVCVSSSVCNILGSAHDVLPLVVLVGVGGNMVENHRYRLLCKGLWSVDVLVDMRESAVCCVAMAFSGAFSWLRDSVSASAVWAIVHRCWTTL